jgi:short-chain 2-methylacyl-CoA dehydrogenase
MDYELTKDQQALKDMVAEFVRAEVAPGAEGRDRDAKFHKDLYLRLADLGVPAIPYAIEDGGLGLGTFAMTLALEEIARVDQPLAVTTMVNAANGLTLAKNADPALKQRWLPPIVSGRNICSLAGTEPGAGSDTAGAATHARQDSNGDWIINGAKAFITNSGADISLFTMVMALTSPPEEARKRFTLFLVPNGTPGFEIGPTYNKMGWRSSDTHPLYFNDCRVGPEAVIGGVGRGRAVTLSGFQQARPFLGACSMGLAQGCLDISVAYAKERKAYGATIGRLQLIQEMIAIMAVKVETARSIIYRTAMAVDAGTATLKDLAIAKYYATEIGSECANLAIQVHGGWGFMDDCPASRYLRDNRVCTIGDGSSQIQLLLVARELGLDVVFNA